MLADLHNPSMAHTRMRVRTLTQSPTLQQGMSHAARQPGAGGTNNPSVPYSEWCCCPIDCMIAGAAEAATALRAAAALQLL